MSILASLFAGLVFGIGLILGGMTNPAKVQNFLDLFGNWDPSLAFVMGGAIMVTAPGFWLLKKRGFSVFEGPFQMPTKKDLDAKLLGGSAIFGIGWGLGGFCPGPAITAMTMGNASTLFFVAAMLVGMFAVKFWEARS